MAKTPIRLSPATEERLLKLLSEKSIDPQKLEKECLTLIMKGVPEVTRLLAQIVPREEVPILFKQLCQKAAQEKIKLGRLSRRI